MKKKIFAIITAAACYFGAVTVMTTYGASIPSETGVSCLKGDANLDTRATVADSVAILQHIANRDKYCLSAQGLVNADVDGVTGVTANDALELQKRDSIRASESSDDNISGVIYTAIVDWTMGHGGFKDNIWERISGGYKAVITNTDQLNVYLSNICTEEKKAEFTEKYDDAFFNDNVLFINTLSQSMGARPLLTINSVDVDEKIKINAECEDPGVGEAVMSICMAQVTISRTAYKAQAVEWAVSTKVYSPYTGDLSYTKRVDYTMGYKGFKNKTGNKLNRQGYSAVIKNSEELVAYLSEVCTEEKIAEYTKMYDEKYFAEKVLFMNIIEQSSGAEACLYITNVEFGDTITVNARWNNEFAAADVMSVCVGVVELSKEAYNDQDVIWTCNNTIVSPPLKDHLSFSVKNDWYCDTGADMKPEVWDVLENGSYSAIITSSTELEEYLSKVLQKELVTEYLDFYKGYFDGCVFLMNFQIQSSGSACRLNVDNAEFSDEGNSIIVTSSWDNSGGSYIDMLSVCFQQIKVQKEQYNGQDIIWNIK